MPDTARVGAALLGLGTGRVRRCSWSASWPASSAHSRMTRRRVRSGWLRGHRPSALAQSAGTSCRPTCTCTRTEACSTSPTADRSTRSRRSSTPRHGAITLRRRDADRWRVAARLRDRTERASAGRGERAEQRHHGARPRRRRTSHHRCCSPSIMTPPPTSDSGYHELVSQQVRRRRPARRRQRADRAAHARGAAHPDVGAGDRARPADDLGDSGDPAAGVRAVDSRAREQRIVRHLAGDATASPRCRNTWSRRSTSGAIWTGSATSASAAATTTGCGMTRSTDPAG